MLGLTMSCVSILAWVFLFGLFGCFMTVFRGSGFRVMCLLLGWIVDAFCYGLVFGVLVVAVLRVVLVFVCKFGSLLCLVVLGLACLGWFT